MVFKVVSSTILESYSVFPSLSHAYMLLNFCMFFSPVNLSYVNLIIRLVKEPRRIEEKQKILPP